MTSFFIIILQLCNNYPFYPQFKKYLTTGKVGKDGEAPETMTAESVTCPSGEKYPFGIEVNTSDDQSEDFNQVFFDTTLLGLLYRALNSDLQEKFKASELQGFFNEKINYCTCKCHFNVQQLIVIA